MTIDLPDIMLLCTDDTLILDAGDGFDSYNWDDVNDGQINPVINAGEYSIEVTNYGCSNSRTITVEPAPDKVELSTTKEICGNNEIFIQPNLSTYDITWSNGSSEPGLTIYEPGVYWFDITDEYGCQWRDTITVINDDSGIDLWVPNSFTPNGDGVNDVFKPIGAEVSDYNLLVFDRWGKLMFESSNANEEWEGDFRRNGRKLATGVFVYRMTYKTKCIIQKENFVGTITLIR